MGKPIRRKVTRRALLQAAGTGIVGAAISKLAVPWVRSASAQGARTMTIALINDVATLDPFNTYDSVALSIERGVYDGLVGFTRDMKLRPELATSWEASADAKTFTFHLRPNVKFHDGTPLNAAAVKLNFDRVLDPANRLIRRSLFEPISTVDAVNDTTVRFNLKAPFGAWLYTLAHPAGRIISPAAIGKGGDFVARNMVGSGPFRFVSWTPGQQVVLERNPEFWQGGPQVDRLIIKPVPEDASRVAMLLSGDAQFVHPVPNVQADAVSRARNVTLQKQWSNVQQDAQMHCQHEPFRNPLVRQALNYAIDKQALVRVILGGLGRVMDSPVASVITGYSVVQAGGWPYDVAKAKTLLAQAGFPKGFETTMWLSNSTEL
ncbi:MAG TPA: ABC transporter substrate-binding protein, partial [bacterium]|nr:ABC transporter substrate-binding protein [bacterium]